MLRQPINATDRCSKSPPGAFPCSLRIVGLWLLAALAAGPGLFAAQYDPGPGKTISLIGQTFQQEYLDYANGTGLTPAGSSHYATFFLGAIEQGDDDPNSRFLDFVIDNNLGEYALVALSLKDNTAAGGYGQMVDDQGPNFNANAIWEALRDVTSGRWDSQIDAFANILSSRPNTKFYLRIGYETSIMLFANQSERYVIDVVNGYANQGINAFENADTIPEWDLDAYPDAYNYIADRIRRVGGVSNVDFVYHPVRGFWDAFWLYPGGSFVDWVALSVFNNDVCLPVGSTTNCSGQSVDPNLQQVLDWARGTLGKPLMIAEATAQVPAANTSGGFNDYLNRLHNLVVANDVRVLAYINSDWPAHGWPPDIWGDSRVEARGSSVLNTYLNLFGSSRYIHFGGGGNPPPPPPPGGCASDAVDFDDGVGSYSSQDSSNGSVSVEDGGCALALSGNRWIGTDATFDVTADTVLEFTFSSTSQGEIHGIGFDEDSSISNDPRVFQIHGTQNWGSAIDGFDYTGGTQTFSIPVGQFYTGNSMRLVFVNDKDSGTPNNTGRFSNVRVSGGGSPPPPPPPPGGLAKLEPSTGQTLLIVGQDLQTVSEYIGSGCCPTPGGITTYVAFYSLLDPNFPQWGALGEDPNGNPNNIDIDWGAGPLNARNAAIGFPDSTLQMGLSIAEGNRGTGETWAPGGIAQIAAGQRDGEIDRLARFFNSISGVPVYLRVGYEFDGQWNLGYENRSNFVAAYRRIVDGLRARGVNNVAYVWQSSSSPIDDILDGFRENLADWYPGDDYVDWVGMSWFLLPDEQALVGGTVSTQRQLGEEILSFARGRGKPVMIAEASPQGYHLSGGFNAHISPVWDGTSAQGQVSKSGNQIWNEWYVPFLSFIRSNGDVIKAVSYINTFWDSQASWGPPYNEGFWGDARVQVNTTVRNRWDSEMSSSFWLHGGPSLFSILGL